MARVRLIGPESVRVPELDNRTVEPDEVVEVPDDRYAGYVCQPATWEGVEEPKDEAAPPLKKTAAKAAAKGSDD